MGIYPNRNFICGMGVLAGLLMLLLTASLQALNREMRNSKEPVLKTRLSDHGC
jgi:hypothetical protein